MFVLTREQHNKAIVLGAAVLGVITQEEAKEAAAKPEGIKVAEAGGYIVGEPRGPAVPTITTSATVSAPAAGKRGPKLKSNPAIKPVQTAVAPPGAGGSNDDGPPAENVQNALRAVMQNAPGLPTIRKWDAKQRRVAVRWTKDPTKPRPEFIVPRAERGSAKATAPSPTETATEKPAPKAPNGTASSEAGDGMSFFDQPS